MNCNIKYINQKFEEFGTKDSNGNLLYNGKTELEYLDKHKNLIQHLLKQKGDLANYYLYEDKGKLCVYPLKYQEFKNAMEFDDVLKDVIVYKQIKTSSKGLPIYAVGVNVFGDTKEVEELDSTSAEIMSMLQIQAMYYNTESLINFSSSMQTYINEFDENFMQWVENAKGNLENYKNSLDSFTNKIFTVSKSDVNLILKNLSSSEKVDQLKGVMDYIAKSNQLINKFNTEYLGTDKNLNILERSRALSLKKEEYKKTKDEQLFSDIKIEENELHTLIDQARHIYHAFSMLELLHADLLKANLKENILDLYDPERINTNLTKIFNKYQDILEEPDLDNFIKSIMKIDKTDFLNPFDYVKKLSSSDLNRKNDLINELNEAFLKSKLKFRGGFDSINKVLLNALNQSQVLKYNLNELLTEITLDTLLPIQKGYIERAENKDYNDEAVNNYKLEREDFKKLLKIANADTGFFSHFLSATVDLKDQFTKTVVTYINDQLSQLRLDSLDDRNLIQKACKDLEWIKKTQEERNQINRLLTTYGYVAKLNSKKQLQYEILEQGKLNPNSILAQSTVYIVNEDNQTNEINFIEGTKPIYLKRVNYFNKSKYVQVKPDRNLIKEYDSFKFTLDKNVFFDNLPRLVDNTMNQIDFKSIISVVNNKSDNREEDMLLFKASLKEIEDDLGIDLTNVFFRYFEGNLETHPNISKNLNLVNLKFINIKETIKNKFIAEFFKDKLKNKNEDETKEILKENGLITNEDVFVDFNTDNSVFKKQKQFLKSNSRETNKSIDWFLKNNLDDLLGFNHEVDNNLHTKNILIQYTDENDEVKIDTFEIVNIFKTITSKSGNTYEVLESVQLTNLRTNELIEDYDTFVEDKIVNLYLKKGELKSTTSLYSVEGKGFSSEERSNWKEIHKNKELTNFYQVNRDVLDKAHKTFGSQKSEGLPKMWITDEKSKFHKLKMFILDEQGRKQLITEWFEKAKDGDSIPLKDADGNFIDIEGNVVDEAVYISKEKFGTDGYTVRYASGKFNKYIPVELRETDIPTMILAYKVAANFNGFQQDNIPLLNSVRTLTQGDKIIGIESRKTIATDTFNNVLRNKATGKVELVEAKNLQNSLITFLDDVLYGVSNKEKIIALGNIRLNLNDLASNIQSVGAFQTLAFNLTTMLPNHGISFINNLSESAMGRYFNKEQFFESYKETWKYAVTEFLADFKSNYLAEKSWQIQAATMFNAISGEFFDEKGLYQTESIAEKIFSNALFFNMNAVEVTNQMLTMVALMKGFKIKNENGDLVSLYDSKEDGWVKGTPLKFKSYVTTEHIIEFSSLVQKVNRQLHGNYQSIDKNMLQRLWYGKLMMTYKRWIYDTIRSRFAPEDISFESSTVEEGYFRTYFKLLIGDNKKLWDEHKFKGFTDKNIALQYGKSLGKLWVKSTIGFIDTATFKVLSKNIPNFNQWMYGNIQSERQKQAITRTTLEMGLFLQFALLTVILHALAENVFDEDEDPVTWKMLKFLEYNAFKMQADMGLYIPHFYAFGLIGSPIPVGFGIDQIMRIQRDWFTIKRLIDNNFAVISDVFDFFENGSFDWAVNDTYDKNGKGYEKGDSKFAKKLQKTVIVPYYQVLRFFNPEDQLSYMNLVFKNAK